MTLKNKVQSEIPLWNGRLAAHHVGYLDNGEVHRGVPYRATDSRVINKKLALMQSQGISLVIETWQGPHANMCHLDAVLTAAICAEVGMQFALLLDPWCARLNSLGKQDQNYTQNVIAALQHTGAQTLLNGSSYLPEKFVLDFNTGADLKALAKTFPHLTFLAQGQGFSWISIPKVTDSVVRNALAVANLKVQHENPAMKVASFCESFDDSGQPLPVGIASQIQFDAAGGRRDLTKGVWGDDPARILESFAGQFGRQQLATIPATVPIIAVITWDDYDEQSSGPLEKTLAEMQGVDWNV